MNFERKTEADELWLFPEFEDLTRNRLSAWDSPNPSWSEIRQEIFERVGGNVQGFYALTIESYLKKGGKKNK